MKSNFICIIGQKRNGKDEVSRILNSKLSKATGAEWNTVGFADKGKELLADLFGVTVDWINHWKDQPEIPPGWKRHVRELLQFFLDGMRQWQPDIWCDRVFDRQGNYTIRDGRYLNEIERASDTLNFNLVVWRPGYENDIPHPSEAECRPIVRALARAYEQKIIEEGLLFQRGKLLEFLSSRDQWDGRSLKELGPQLSQISAFIANDGDLSVLEEKLGRLLPKLVSWSNGMAPGFILTRGSLS